MKPVFSTHKKPQLAGQSWEAHILPNGKYAMLRSDLVKYLVGNSKNPDFISMLITNISRYTDVSPELINAIENPIEMTLTSGKSKLVYSLELIPAICAEIIVAKAHGFLLSTQIPIAKQAQKLFDAFSFDTLKMQIDKNSGFLNLKLTVKEKLVAFMIDQEPREEIYWAIVLNDNFYENALKVADLNWRTAIGNEALLANLVYDMIFMRIPNSMFANLRSSSPKRAYISKEGYVKTQNYELQEFATKIGKVIKKCNYSLSDIDRQLHIDFPKFYQREELAFTNINQEIDKHEMEFDKTIRKAFSGKPSDFIGQRRN